MSLNTFLQYALPKRFLSKLASQLAHCRTRWWKNWAISYFIRKYQVDLASAVLERKEDYPDFNSFFTRYLKPELRPIAKEPWALTSPVDGCISQIGKIRQDLLIQAKGFYFNLHALLGGKEQYARSFYDGSFATLYLSPKDYHRVHMPITGVLRETIYVPGSLFSVSQANTRQISQLFVQNERLICFFETELGPVAIILVGAIIVSGIHAVWPFAKHNTRITQQSYTGVQLEQGAELGHFSIGSTVILLFAKNTMEWAARLHEGITVQMGEIIGKKLN